MIQRSVHQSTPPPSPKVSLDAAIERWQLTTATDAKPDPKPNLAQYDEIRAEWRSKNRVTKFLEIVQPVFTQIGR